MWGSIAAWFFVMHTDPVAQQIHARMSNAALYERAGRLASAWREVAFARDLMKKSADRELGRHVEERSTQLGQRVGYRLLDVKLLGATDIIVEQDGVPVPRFEWNHAEPIDSGPHVWTARMEDFVFWRFEGVARDGASTQVSPELPSLPPSDEPPPEGLTAR